MSAHPMATPVMSFSPELLLRAQGIRVAAVWVGRAPTDGLATHDPMRAKVI
jgi:hypothetical protein